ncbi:hypothetical protein ACOBQJ_02495 [Pelotomaculum propionicicum]|uniref:hypothetical protein n=1 Tax=Pelotomaculum propionicicum TaxID=258475 RepID=UPI003B8225F3
MYNWALIDKVTGQIINAVSTINEGVKPLPESENQEVLSVSQAGFYGIINGQLKYYNYNTDQLEPDATK